MAIGQGLSSALLTSAFEEGPPAEEEVRTGRKLRLGLGKLPRRSKESVQGLARRVEKKLEIIMINRQGEKGGLWKGKRRRDTEREIRSPESRKNRKLARRAGCGGARL